jgi:hypothetical protein
LIRKYLTITKFDFSYNDTTVFSFTRGLREIPFSLSPRLDTIPGYKLNQIKLIYNKAYSDSFKITMPAREWIFEIKPAFVEDLKRYELLIKHYEMFKRDI